MHTPLKSLLLLLLCVFGGGVLVTFLVIAGAMLIAPSDLSLVSRVAIYGQIAGCGLGALVFFNRRRGVA